MGRGKRGFLDALAGLPWPVGLAVGALGFFVIGQGIPVWFARQGGPLSRAFAGAAQPFSLLAWVFLAMCALAAFASFRDAQRKRRLFDTRTGLDSIAALGWRDFERLVGEAFRRRGYVVEETGLGGADGGIDLILRRDGRRVLVQCKQWRRERVPVNVVREMYGLLGHHRADAVRIAALGGFTPDAGRLAQDDRGFTGPACDALFLAKRCTFRVAAALPKVNACMFIGARHHLEGANDQRNALPVRKHRVGEYLCWASAHTGSGPGPPAYVGASEGFG